MQNKIWTGKKCRFCGGTVFHSEGVERKALVLIGKMGEETKEKAYGLLLDNCDRCLPVNAFIQLGLLTEEEGKKRCVHLRDEIARLQALVRSGGLSRDEYASKVGKLRKEAFLPSNGVSN